MKRFSPNNCSVIVFHNSEEDFKPTLKLIYNAFSNVVVESKQTNVISELKTQNKTTSTILLIDADSCTYKYPDECPDLLLAVVNLLNQGLVYNVVPIVCSIHDSPSFMVKCLQEGAADYLLKPISEDSIKTLFLNVTRYKTQKNEKLNVNKVNQDLENGQIWSKFKGRLKGVFSQENWLSKAIVDYYTPMPSVRKTSMSTILNERIDYLKRKISSWDFSPLDLNDQDLIQCVFMILNHTLLSFDELKFLRVPSGDLYHFIFDICNSYHSINHYHNFRHAVDVLQANYYFLCKMGLLKSMVPEETCIDSNLVGLLEPLDIFALLMASIGHDVGHPGVNNNFMVTTATPLAVLYNDKSVLENFHAMSFFHLLRDHCFNQLTDVRSSSNYAGFRKIVVNSILATDMSMHDEYVQNIKQQAIRFKERKVDFKDKASCEKEKILLCGALIKCADISNCARPFESAKRWAQILAEEFFEQGDLEKELKLPVLPINERGKIPLPDFQLSFKKFVAIQLFQSMSSVAPGLQFAVDQINENISIWEKVKKEIEISTKDTKSNIAIHVPEEQSPAKNQN